MLTGLLPPLKKAPTFPKTEQLFPGLFSVAAGSFRYYIQIFPMASAAAAAFEEVSERELAHILEYVGQGQHLYICGVNRALHAQNHKPRDDARRTKCKTNDAAIFASASRLQLATQNGFSLHDKQRRAGRHACKAVLHEAKRLGLPFDEELCRGAVRSGDVLKVRWLVEEQLVTLPADIAVQAAECGFLDMLKLIEV